MTGCSPLPRYPPSLQLNVAASNTDIVRERRLYVIRNARLDPQWSEIKRSTFSIVGRAISSLIQTQGVGDLYRIYVADQRDKIDFNLASIPETFTTKLQPFETNYINALFELGYELGKNGYPWAKFPPAVIKSSVLVQHSARAGGQQEVQVQILDSGKLRAFYRKNEAVTKKPGLEELFKGLFLAGYNRHVCVRLPALRAAEGTFGFSRLSQINAATRHSDYHFIYSSFVRRE